MAQRLLWGYSVITPGVRVFWLQFLYAVLASWKKSIVRRIVILSVFVFIPAFPLSAAGYEGGRLVEVETIGSCAVVEDISGHQAQVLALRQARALAVEKAVGVRVCSSSLVTDGRLATEFIKTLARGYIVEEACEWGSEEFQGDLSRPPVVEYQVRLRAKVRVPAPKSFHFGLDAALNQHTYRAYREQMVLEVKTAAPARVAVFNLTADDRVMMLYPDTACQEISTGGPTPLRLPPAGGDQLFVANLDGHKQDTEAIMVAALDGLASRRWMDFFVPGELMSLVDFFTRYAEVADNCEDVVLPYVVFAEEEER